MGTRHLAFWPPGLPPELSVPQTTLWSNLAASATRSPDRPCLVFYDGVLSYAEVKRECERLAAFLQQECGVKRGDRVAIQLQNSPQFVIAYYAILRADAVVVPVNPMNRTLEIEHMLNDSESHVLITAQDIAAESLPLLDQGTLRHLIIGTYSDYLTAETDLKIPDFLRAPRQAFDAPGVMVWKDAMNRNLTPSPHTATADDLCVIPYTSGTTGKPKGCMHIHRSVMYTTVACPEWNGGVKFDECVLAVVPLFHVTGMQNSMNSSIYMGATIVVLPRWDPKVAAELIQRYRVTSWTAVPTMVVDLLSSVDVDRYDFSSIRLIGGGGAAMPEAIAQKLKDLCGLTYIEGYGLSETIAPTHINPPHRPKKQCLGIPIFGTDSRVVDLKTLVELPPGEVGEIVTNGPQVFQGYWKNREANEDCFVEIDGKRFFRTGDLARTDDEGYFYLVDRIKRMINASGFKVWPAEVETMLYAHPAVKEAAVIKKKDPRRGETVKAVVVLKPGKGDGVDERSFIEWCHPRMAAYKVPRSVEFRRESLPRGSKGQLDWQKLELEGEQKSSEAMLAD